MAEVVAQPVTGRVSSSTSYVEWGAVLAGAVLAASLSFVLLTFGTGIGLSLLSPILPIPMGEQRDRSPLCGCWWFRLRHFSSGVTSPAGCELHERERMKPKPNSETVSTARWFGVSAFCSARF